jgi:UDP-glucose 4-epimerase
MKKVLLLGASGMIAPHIIPGLEPYYDLRLTDIQPHPEGKPILTVDVSSYEQVLEAARGMDAIMNFTVNRPHPVLSFEVNTKGAFHVMKAAAELGIRKVLHTAPELVIPHYHHEFDIGDVPQMPSTGYYFVTKYLSLEICKIYARTYGIQTVCFQFNQLGAKPAGPIRGRDCPPFMIVWEDLVEACRLALEIEAVPDHFQSFNLHSFSPQGKYSIEKAQRMLGYTPRVRLGEYYKRSVS